MEILNQLITGINDIIWTYVLVAVLIGCGLWFSLRTRFIQFRLFREMFRTLGDSTTRLNEHEQHISSFQAFTISLASRVGTGNLAGVATAITVGGPGAVFWMWVIALLGASSSFVESTLAQLFKERRNGEFVGGLPFYGRALFDGSRNVGIFLSLLYIFYALGCLPAQGFNVVSSIGAIGSMLSGAEIPTNSAFYYGAAAVVLIGTGILSFGGIKKVTKTTNTMVPVMAVVYVVTTILLIVANVDSVPYFFKAVFVGAFKPEAFFGGVFGTVLVQGVKRGLMSNEAGQGTITMSAASADDHHPCEQGLLSAAGVFLDTHIICTMTGFIIIMAHSWLQQPTAWKAAGKLPKYLMAVTTLTHTPGLNLAVTLALTLCFCLFAYTCLIGMISFSEIASARLSRDPKVIVIVRCLCLAVATFGVLVNIAGYDLGNLWAFSDLANIIMVYCNIPLLYKGFKYVLKAKEHFVSESTEPFDGKKVLGIETPCWPRKK